MDIQVRDRKYWERWEEKYLASYAVKSGGANSTRLIPEEEHPYRTAIQRDRDRIIHSRAFRRLKHKQQVFLISEGDHYRTRLTHTLEVSQIARTIAKTLALNEELVEAIALGHDLGHTPFGHAGEVVLNDILSGKDSLDGLLPKHFYGGFKHNYQSLRVVDLIEKKYQHDGLNLTAYVREGILKHTRLRRNNYNYPDFFTEGINFEIDFATTIEGQVVAICDEIAQRTHDLEDGIRAGFVELEQVRELEIVAEVERKFNISPLLIEDSYVYRNALINGLITILINDVISTTISNLKKFYTKKKRLLFFDEEIVKFSSFMEPLQQKLNSFIYSHIIFKNADKEIIAQKRDIIRQLFVNYFLNHAELPNYIQQKSTKQNLIRLIADHIAGMTDRFAELEFEKLKQKESKR